MDMRRTQDSPLDFHWLSDEVNACPYPFYTALHREGAITRYPGRRCTEPTSPS
jgi:hypothetical protein